VIWGGMWGRGSECEAITVKREDWEIPAVFAVAVVPQFAPQPTEHLVRAVTAKEETVIGRPSREEIVTVTTCESMWFRETVQGMAGTACDDVKWREALHVQTIETEVPGGRAAEHVISPEAEEPDIVVAVNATIEFSKAAA